VKQEEKVMKTTLVSITAVLMSIASHAGDLPAVPVTIVDTPVAVTVRGQPVKVTSAVMNLGTEFRTLSLQCGTLTGPAGDCPKWADPQGSAYLLHSVSLVAKADGNCSAMAWLRFNPPDGLSEDFKLVSVAVNAHGYAASGGGQEGGSDSVAITFPKPIRVGPNDQFGLGNVYGGGPLCAVSVSYGIELTR
jgi:hypothetical protein